MSKVVRNKLFEDPDTSGAGNNKKLRWDDHAYPFIYDGESKELGVGSINRTHGTVNMQSDYRDVDYQGRIWPKEKVIAFWEAPTKKILLNILDQFLLNNEISAYDLKEDDWNDFLFDIPNPDQTSDNEDAIFSLSDYPDDPNLKSSHLIRPEHTVSPMLKKNQPKASGGGSMKYAKEKPLAYRQALQTSESIVRPTINESPDTMCSTPSAISGSHGNYIDSWTCVGGREHRAAYYNDKDARAFGVVDVKEIWGGKIDNYGKMWVGNEGETHGLAGRWDYKFAGRLWTTKKLISFWEYPSPKDMDRVITMLAMSLRDKGLYDGEETIDEIKKKLGEYLIEIIKKADSDDDFKYIWRVSGEWKKWSGDRSKESFTTVYMKVKNYGNLTSVNQLDKENLAGEHGKSPMQKNKKSVPHGFGSNHPEAEKQADKRRNEPFESLVQKSLNENPNAIIDPKVWERRKGDKSYTPPAIEYNEDGNIPFGYYGTFNTLVIGTNNMIHQNLKGKAVKLGLIKFARDNVERGRNSGRLFPSIKVISFWNFPKDYAELEKVIKDLEKAKKINILNDPEWKIEIPSGEFKNALDDDSISWGSWTPRIGHQDFISIKDYKGGYQRSEKDLGQQHVMSPMDSRKEKKTISSWGKGKLQGLERLKWKMAHQSESFYPRLK